MWIPSGDRRDTVTSPMVLLPVANAPLNRSAIYDKLEVYVDTSSLVEFDKILLETFKLLLFGNK